VDALMLTTCDVELWREKEGFETNSSFFCSSQYKATFFQMQFFENSVPGAEIIRKLKCFASR
jgi:hypothetical protein